MSKIIGIPVRSHVIKLLHFVSKISESEMSQYMNKIIGIPVRNHVIKQLHYVSKFLSKKGRDI